MASAPQPRRDVRVHTPAAVAARVNAEVNRTLALPEVAEPFAREGAGPVPTTPQGFGELIRREIPRQAESVKAGNAKPDCEARSPVATIGTP